MLPLGNCFWRAACAKAAYLTEELCSPQRKTYKKTAMSQLTNHIPAIRGAARHQIQIRVTIQMRQHGQERSAKPKILGTLECAVAIAEQEQQVVAGVVGKQIQVAIPVDVPSQDEPRDGRIQGVSVLLGECPIRILKI